MRIRHGVDTATIYRAGQRLQGIRLRKYNPRLVTLIILFPVGAGGLWVISATGKLTAFQHIFWISLSLAIHIGIVAYVLSNRRRLARG